MKKNKNYPLYHLLPDIQDLRQMLEIKAQEKPDEVAFRYMRDRKTLVEKTYGQFLADVKKVGTYLLKRGIRGRKIALIGENSYRWLISYFAIINTGNVAVLIAKDSSVNEVATLLFQSDAEMVVTSRACAPIAEFCKQKFPKKKRFFSMDEMGEWLEQGERFQKRGKQLYEKVQIDPDALCTIFFTSGSTGFSKGVMLSHTNMAWNISHTVQNFVLEGPTMAVLPFNHAFGLVTSVFKAFHYGYPVFICSNLSNFMREIPIAKPQTLFLVPLFLETFSKTIWRTAEKQKQDKTLRRGMAASDALLKLGIDRRKQFFSSVLDKFGGNLEYIICGGAPLDPRFVKEFRSLGVEVLNGYGITECSPVLAVNRNHYGRDGSVGQIVPGTEVKIDNPDEKGQGEIIVKGKNVMLGYYNDPVSTAEVIRDGWFHTGDMGFIDKDGFLFVSGRKKNLIILSNGENVSPEEIEQYVERIPEVQEVVVYEDGHAIVAEVFPEESDLPKEELTKVIQKKIDKMNATLPNHKHVQKLRVRDTEFEKTATKKIKRYKANAKKNDTQQNNEL
jgi:long-chain acyl-CoA synthetase